MKILFTLTTALLLTIFSLQAQEIVKIEDRFDKKPIVKMKLNGKTIWVLLDTGSSVNLLDLSSMRKYKFKTFGQASGARNVIGLGSDEMRLQEVGNIDLVYKGISLKGQFLAYDISDLIMSFQAESGIAISGIIGSELMRKYGFVIDMRNNKASMSYRRKKGSAPAACSPHY